MVLLITNLLADEDDMEVEDETAEWVTIIDSVTSNQGLFTYFVPLK